MSGEALKALHAHLKDISQLEAKIEGARRSVEVAKYRVSNLIIGREYNRDPIEPELKTVIDQGLEFIRRTFRSKAEAERNRLLIEHAKDLDVLRSALPDLAAAAAVDMGAMAADLRHEAAQ